MLPGHGDAVTDHVALIDERFRPARAPRGEDPAASSREQPRSAYEIAQELWGNVAVDPGVPDAVGGPRPRRPARRRRPRRGAPGHGRHGLARGLGAPDHRIPASSRLCGRFLRRPPVPCATCERCGHPLGVRDGDPDAVAALIRRRGAAVLGYCEEVAAPGAAVPAASEAFGSFRDSVADAPDVRSFDAEGELVRGTRVRRRQPRAARRPRHADGADAARRAGRGRPRARGRGAPHPTAGPLERGAHVGRPDAPRRGCLHRPRGGPPAACGRPAGRHARHRRRHPGDAEDPGRRPRMAVPSRSTTPSQPPA